MITNQILQGDHKQWRILELIAKGDAGEVYLVESVLDRKQAVLKRPHSGGFSADITRQSTQIAAEASILKVLSGLQLQFGEYSLKIGELLDQSLPGTELTDHFFIVVEKAPGLNLTALSRIVRFGLNETGFMKLAHNVEQKSWLEELATLGKLPNLLLLRVINALFDLLPAIHNREGPWFGENINGVLWNDIKPDHIFWDPDQSCLTVIDWGNGQFLEKNRVSRDRRFSPEDDYCQLIEEMGRFLLDSASHLHHQLDWPVSISSHEASPEGLNELHQKTLNLLNQETAKWLQARQHESFLLSSGSSSVDKLNDLSEAQRKIYSYAEIPDLAATARLVERTASILASSGDLVKFRQVCAHARKVKPEEVEKWSLLEKVAEFATSTDGFASEHFLEALRSGVNGDWAAANWSLFLVTSLRNEADDWRNYSSQIRRIVPEISADAPTPYLALSRMMLILDDDLSRLKSRSRIDGNTLAEEPSKTLIETISSLEALIARLKFEIMHQWMDVDPLPPGSALTYSSIEAMLSELQEFLPQVGIDPIARLGTVRRALSQPIAQANILLDAWLAMGFKTARQVLRQLLLWDPDRKRVLRADALIDLAPTWLAEVRNGPQAGEKLKEFTIRLEYTGRELRSRVGIAPWIDTPLWLFSELRSGAKPGDLLAENQDLSADYPWLRRFDRKIHPESLPVTASASSRPQAYQPASPPRQGKLGAGQDLHMLEPLDAWVPEARGSSARVFSVMLSQPTGRPVQAALKIMRPDKANYALPLFWEEVQILSILQDTSGIVHALECGFIKVDGYQELPGESLFLNAGALSGEVIRYSLDSADLYLEELADRAASGWLPYIALEKVKQAECLLLACDEGYTKGRYMHVESAVQITIQICEILQAAHERDIVYRDHKILHYYWDPIEHRVSMIDWNVAKWYTDGLSKAEKLFDLVQLGARGLHHLFTGRPAPGALPVGPTRPEEVELAPHSYAPAWTYDDKQRLSLEIRDILAALLTGGYESAAQLREDFLLQLSFSKR
jgi:serine/threonine protein kinase